MPCNWATKREVISCMVLRAPHGSEHIRPADEHWASRPVSHHDAGPDYSTSKWYSDLNQPDATHMQQPSITMATLGLLSS